MAIKKIISRGKTTVIADLVVPSPVNGWHLGPGSRVYILLYTLSESYKSGTILEVKIQPFQEPDICRKVVAYWYGEIIRKIREGLYDTGVCLNDAGTESWLRDRIDENASLSTAALRKFASAVQVDRETGQIREVIPVISNMDKNELRSLFDPIIAWSSENLHAAIIELDDFNW